MESGLFQQYSEQIKKEVSTIPNHVRNVIKISKIKPEEIKMVLDMITDKWCDPDVPGKAEYMIDFDKITPEPKDESECPDEYKVNKESHIESLKDRPWFDWYKWHIDHWGTKWGAYDGYTKIGKTWIMLVFNTAWTAPMPIIYKLSVLGYEITVRYADEDYGVNCGRLTYKREQGWIWDSMDLINPEQFARNLWNNY